MPRRRRPVRHRAPTRRRARGGRCGRRDRPAAGHGWRGRRRRRRTAPPGRRLRRPPRSARSWPTVGLVEDQHRRPVGNGAGEGEPAHLAAGELVRVRAGEGARRGPRSSASARRPASLWSSPRGRLVLSTSSRTVRETTRAGPAAAPSPPAVASSGTDHRPGEASAAGASQSAPRLPRSSQPPPGEQGGEAWTSRPRWCRRPRDLAGADSDVDAVGARARAASGVRAAVRPTAAGRATPDARAWTANADQAPPGEADWTGGPLNSRRHRPRRPSAGAQSAAGTVGGAGASTPGTQTPWAAEVGRAGVQRRDDGPSAVIRPGASRTTSRSTSLGPRLEPVLDQDHGAARPAHGVGDDRRTAAGGAGSSIAVGSSSRTRRGPIARTPASASRCASPPDSASAGWSAP